MFIIKLGAEALNKLEEQLIDKTNENVGVQKNVKGNNLYSHEEKLESSILYNLLSNDENLSMKPQSLLFPNYFLSKFEDNLPPRANTISYSKPEYYDVLSVSPRPYSAPESNSDICNQKSRKRKQINDIPTEYDELKMRSFKRNCKISSKSSVDSQSMSCSTDSCGDEPMDLSRTRENISTTNVTSDYVDKCLVNSWLLKIVSLINTTNKQFNNNLVELPPGIRLHLLQSSWHRIMITYLFEHLISLPNSISVELWTFLQSVSGITNQSVLSKKKMSCMYKSVVEELNVILYQIKKLNLDDISMNFLRIGLFFTGNHDENNQKNVKLIELFIQSKIDGSAYDSQIVCDLVDNLLKLNSVIIETIFYSHLSDTVENVIDQLFTKS